MLDNFRVHVYATVRVEVEVAAENHEQAKELADGCVDLQALRGTLQTITGSPTQYQGDGRETHLREPADLTKPYLVSIYTPYEYAEEVTAFVVDKLDEKGQFIEDESVTFDLKPWN